MKLRLRQQDFGDWEVFERGRDSKHRHDVEDHENTTEQCNRNHDACETDHEHEWSKKTILDLDSKSGLETIS